MAPTDLGTTKKVRMVGYLGRSKAFTRKTFSLEIPDVTTHFVKPLPNPTFRDPFGKDRSNDRNPTRRHLGIDYETRTVDQVRRGAGTDKDNGVLGIVPAYAIADGVVEVRGEKEGYGRVVYINHGNGVSSRYAHLSAFKVQLGDQVTKGQIIAMTGTSETKKGRLYEEGLSIPHLHFEMRMNLGFFETGQLVGGISDNDRNIAFDPISTLEAAPNPGEAVVAQSPESKKLAAARAEVATLMTTATTDYATLESAQAYDQLSALARNCSMAELSRGAYWDEAARSSPVLRSTVEQDVGLSVNSFTSYS